MFRASLVAQWVPTPCPLYMDLWVFLSILNFPFKPIFVLLNQVGVARETRPDEEMPFEAL